MTRTHTRLAALLAATALTVALTGCASHHSSNAASSTAPSKTSSPTPTAYPIPTGCPSAAELQEATEDPSPVDPVNPTLLNDEVATPLPTGGCAYLVGAARQSDDSSDTYRNVEVWYFNIDQPGKQSTAAFEKWATSAGGTTTSGEKDNWDLPESFSNWTNSAVGIAGGDTGSSWGIRPNVIPAYTQNAEGKIGFAVSASVASALVSATAKGAAAEGPTKALPNGLAASYSTSFSMKDGQGYTADVTLKGTLEPFTSDIEDSAPGQFQPISESGASGSFTNTTAGRNTQTTDIGVMALYAQGTAPCPGQGVSVEGADWDQPSYCGVILQGLPAASLSPGESDPVAGTSSKVSPGTYPQTPTVLSQFNNPVAIYAYFGGEGTNMTDVDWTGSTGCLAQTFSIGGQWFVPMSGWPDVLCKG